MTASQSAPNPQPVGGNDASECDGICIRGCDILPGGGDGVAYAHPGCPLHAPGEKCGCGLRMCMDCGGPWCAICNQRVPEIPWGDEMVCDSCHRKLVGFGLALPSDHRGRVQMWDQEDTPPGEPVWVSPVVHETGGQS